MGRKLDYLFQYRLIAGSYWIATFGEGVARIVLPLYFIAKGLPPAEIGLVFFFFEMAGWLTNLAGGYILNRIGYRKTFLFALLLQAIAGFGYLALEFTPSVTMMVVVVSVLRAFKGMGKEFTKLGSSAAVKHYASSKRRRSASAQVLLGGKDVVKGGGILIGGLLLANLGFANTFVVLGTAMLLLLAVCGWRMEDFRESNRVALGQIYRVRWELQFLALARSFLYFGRDIWLVVVVPIFLVESGFSPELISLLMAFALVLSGMTQISFGAFVKWTVPSRRRLLKRRWAFRRTMLSTAMVAALIPAILLLVGESRDFFLTAVIVFSFAIGMATSPHNYLQIKYSRRKVMASDLSWYKTVAHTGKMIAVLISGILYAKYGLAGCLLVSTLALTLSGILAYTTDRVVEGKKARSVVADQPADRDLPSLDHSA